MFCDSKLALRAASSHKPPRTNVEVSKALRSVFLATSKVLSLDLQWIRGHVQFGGNERVDRTSKAFASHKLNNTIVPFNGVFFSQNSCRDWVVSFPLLDLPLQTFLVNPFCPTVCDGTLLPVNAYSRSASSSFSSHAVSAHSDSMGLSTFVVFSRRRSHTDKAYVSVDSKVVNTTSTPVFQRKRSRPDSVGLRRSARLNVLTLTTLSGSISEPSSSGVDSHDNLVDFELCSDCSRVSDSATCVSPLEHPTTPVHTGHELL